MRTLSVVHLPVQTRLSAEALLRSLDPVASTHRIGILLDSLHCNGTDPVYRIL